MIAKGGLRLILASIIIGASCLAMFFWATSEEGGEPVCLNGERDGLVIYVKPFESNGFAKITTRLSRPELGGADVKLLMFGLSTSARNPDATFAPLLAEYDHIVSPVTLSSQGFMNFKVWSPRATYVAEKQGSFPWDAQTADLSASAAIHTTGGESFEYRQAGNACVEVGPLYRVQFQSADHPNSAVSVRVTRQPWFIALVCVAIAMVWVPFVADTGAGVTGSEALDLIATLTAAASIRAFLTRDSEPFSYAFVDVMLGLPLLLFAIRLLLRSPLVGRHSAEEVRQAPARKWLLRGRRPAKLSKKRNQLR